MKCVNDSAFPSNAYQFVKQYSTIYLMKSFGEVYIAFVNCELFLNQTSQYKEIVRYPVFAEKSIVDRILHPYVTLNFDLTHDLDLRVSRTDFEVAISLEREGRFDIEPNGCELTGCLTIRYHELWFHPWPWHKIFGYSILNSYISGLGDLLDLKRNGYEPTAWCLFCVTVAFGAWTWIFKMKFRKTLDLKYNLRYTFCTW